MRIITENPQFAGRIPKLFHKAFGLKFDRVPEPEQTGKLIFQMLEQKKLDHIINALGYDPQQNTALHINFGILEDECCRASFLRGVFFAGGSITDPLKSYHLELNTSHRSVSLEMDALLQDTGFQPKDVRRNGGFITYFKQSEHIEDFLTLIGAPVAAMKIMTAKMEKEVTNRVNRRLNCDSANLTKTVSAAQEQLEAIRLLEEANMLENLPDKLRETASLRLLNPELTLTELAEEFIPPLTKSCLNHRLRKLQSLARELNKGEEKHGTL